MRMGKLSFCFDVQGHILRRSRLRPGSIIRGLAAASMDGMQHLLVAALLLSAPGALRAADDPALLRARRILAATPLIDGHNDLPWAIREYEKAPRDVAAYDLRSRTPGHTDLARLAAGQVGGQFWSVYVPGELGEGYAR